jgi:hypothetical protein
MAWLAPLPLVCVLVAVMFSVGRARDRVEVIQDSPTRDAPGPAPSPGSTVGTTVLAHPAPSRGTGPLAGGGPPSSRIDAGDSPEVTRVGTTPAPSSPSSPSTSAAADTTSSSAPAASATPDDVDDCKEGGWRTLQDDQGRPFPNQGACVRFVQEGG